MIPRSGNGELEVKMAMLFWHLQQRCGLFQLPILILELLRDTCPPEGMWDNFSSRAQKACGKSKPEALTSLSSLSCNLHPWTQGLFKLVHGPSASGCLMLDKWLLVDQPLSYPPRVLLIQMPRMSCCRMAEQKESTSSNHPDSPLLLLGIHTYCELQEKSKTWKQSAEGFRFSVPLFQPIRSEREWLSTSVSSGNVALGFP
ncbi:hypothetical protein DV515_00006025 [Chloebia gouldiae]|uniref:Uncharacterized protein n=1 Tax=Chloebia gouldiae TaxID=44316 RepID=A0A3L8SL41_CHLGU|nr:hypothetical protein DV515_00006025 [Chloebia gouldiae]